MQLPVTFVQHAHSIVIIGAYLALRGLILLDTEAHFRHCLLDYTNGIWHLCRGIDTLLCHESGYLFPKRCQVMFTFLLSNLYFAFIEDLAYICAVSGHSDQNVWCRTNLLHNFVHICGTKGLLEVAVLRNLAFRYVNKHAADLQDVI